MKIENKNIIITGATSGIGLELLYALKKYSGIQVIAVGRNIEKIPNAEYIIPYRCDISQKEELDNLFCFALKRWRKIDIFIANAGYGIYENIDKSDWYKTENIFRTNVFSPIYSYQKMKETHKEYEEYSFLTTASAMSYFALPYYTLYTSTKFALQGFLEAIRYEQDKNAHISLIYPVSTKTNFFNNSSSNSNCKMPWPRQTPNKVAKAIINGIEKNSRKIYPYKGLKLILLLYRIFPSILRFNLKSQMTKP